MSKRCKKRLSGHHVCLYIHSESKPTLLHPVSRPTIIQPVWANQHFLTQSVSRPTLLHSQCEQANTSSLTVRADQHFFTHRVNKSTLLNPQWEQTNTSSPTGWTGQHFLTHSESRPTILFFNQCKQTNTIVLFTVPVESKLYYACTVWADWHVFTEQLLDAAITATWNVLFASQSSMSFGNSNCKMTVKQHAVTHDAL